MAPPALLPFLGKAAASAGISFGVNKLFGGRGGGGGGVQRFDPIPFRGQRPFTAGAVGLGAEAIKPLSEQFIAQILRRSRGEGFVGFDPRRREVLRGEFLADIGESEEESRRQALAIATGQGLRGGIPIDIARRQARDFSRARASGLADIDIADLTARRLDINRATELQPGVVSQGAGIQQARSVFDLAEHQLSQPTFVLPSGGRTSGTSLANVAGNLLGGFGQTPSGGVQSRIPSPNTSIGRNQFISQFARDPFAATRRTLRRF